MKLSQIKPNPKNPRVVRDKKFEALKASIQKFPKMLELRPLIIDEANTVLGGNSRLRALQELGYKDIPDTWVKRADEFSEAEKKEFIIKDNVSAGEWDYEALANEWEDAMLRDWGVISWNTDFEPVTDPVTFSASKFTDPSQQEIEDAEARAAARRALSSIGNKKVCCPNCATEFFVS